jgi:hypothetical protein
MSRCRAQLDTGAFCIAEGLRPVTLYCGEVRLYCDEHYPEANASNELFIFRLKQDQVFYQFIKADPMRRYVHARQMSRIDQEIELESILEGWHADNLDNL